MGIPGFVVGSMTFFWNLKLGLNFVSWLPQGLTRTIQGPSLLDLKEQVGVEVKDFQTMFLVGALSFPLGNVIGKSLLKVMVQTWVDSYLFVHFQPVWPSTASNCPPLWLWSARSSPSSTPPYPSPTLLVHSASSPYSWSYSWAWSIQVWTGVEQIWIKPDSVNLTWSLYLSTWRGL